MTAFDLPSPPPLVFEPGRHHLVGRVQPKPPTTPDPPPPKPPSALVWQPSMPGTPPTPPPQPDPRPQP